MTPVIYITIISMAVSSAIVSSFLPKILVLSLRRKLIDAINPRKVHLSVASRLGGMAFYPAIFISMTLCVTLYRIVEGVDIPHLPYIAIEFVAMFLLYMVGIWDDLVSVAYRNKFLAQLLAAVLIVTAGVRFECIHILNTTLTIPLVVSCPLSVLFIIFVTNAINLIDGIDGLASSLSTLALTIYGFASLYLGNNMDCVLAFTTVGALIPFFCYNLFGIRQRTRAKIFMGDGGSLVIGFILSVISIRLWNTSAVLSVAVSSNLFYVLAYTMLFVPVMDAVRVMVDRYINKRNMFLPDRNHIHHRFLDLGCSPRISLFAILLMQVGFVVFNIVLSMWFNILYIFLIDILLWRAINIYIGRRIGRVEPQCASK